MLFNGALAALLLVLVQVALCAQDYYKVCNTLYHVLGLLTDFSGPWS